MSNLNTEFDIPGGGKLVVGIRHKGRRGLLRHMHRLQRERCNHGDTPCLLQGIDREVFAVIPLPFLAQLLRSLKTTPHQ